MAVKHFSVEDQLEFRPRRHKRDHTTARVHDVIKTPTGTPFGCAALDHLGYPNQLPVEAGRVRGRYCSGKSALWGLKLTHDGGMLHALKMHADTVIAIGRREGSRPSFPMVLFAPCLWAIKGCSICMLEVRGWVLQWPEHRLLWRS